MDSYKLIRMSILNSKGIRKFLGSHANITGHDFCVGGTAPVRCKPKKEGKGPWALAWLMVLVGKHFLWRWKTCTLFLLRTRSLNKEWMNRRVSILSKHFYSKVPSQQRRREGMWTELLGKVFYGMAWVWSCLALWRVNTTTTTTAPNIAKGPQWVSECLIHPSTKGLNELNKGGRRAAGMELEWWGFLFCPNSGSQLHTYISV